MNTWFTADTHYYHANIARYTHRPFIQPGDLDDEGMWRTKEIGRTRAKEMTEAMIKIHNALVKPEDTVYHLGDFAFGGVTEITSLLRRLNGHYRFVWGNHDKAMHDFAAEQSKHSDLQHKIEFLDTLAEICIEGHNIVLCHYPLYRWNRSHHLSWMLHGHCHYTLPESKKEGLPLTMGAILDVGVDGNQFKPYTFTEIKLIMQTKTSHYTNKMRLTTHSGNGNIGLHETI